MLSASIGQTNSRASIPIWILSFFADLTLRRPIFATETPWASGMGG